MKTTDKQANAVIRSVEKELTKKKETNMKTPTDHPQLKGALKTIGFLIAIAAIFYAGTQYQEQYHQKVTSEATQLVSQLKPQAR